jgi:hypothetical protein
MSAALVIVLVSEGTSHFFEFCLDVFNIVACHKQ